MTCQAEEAQRSTRCQSRSTSAPRLFNAPPLRYCRCATKARCFCDHTHPALPQLHAARAAKQNAVFCGGCAVGRAALWQSESCRKAPTATEDRVDSGSRLNAGCKYCNRHMPSALGKCFQLWIQKESDQDSSQASGTRVRFGRELIQGAMATFTTDGLSQRWRDRRRRAASLCG